MLVIVSFGIPVFLFFAGLYLMIRNEMRCIQPKTDKIDRLFLKDRPKKRAGSRKIIA